MSKETITEFEVGQRLDKVLVAVLPQYSRATHAKLIDAGMVKVNGAPSKARYLTKHSDVITVDTTQLDAPIAAIDIPVIYEDEHIIVLNKPSGILTHSKGELNNEPTVATFIQPKLTGDQAWKASNRAGIVHRLDRGTSGVIICAKDKPTADYLQGQFSKRNIKKTYAAIIAGELPEAEGLIDVPIERNPKKPSQFRPGINGKTAQTNFKVLNFTKGFSLVELKPFTGRTHQLRVHLKYLNHPIVGDTIYGGETAPRLMLHARQLELTLPSSHERRVFTAPDPLEFNEYI